MSEWKRPHDFEERAEEKFNEMVDEGDFPIEQFEAFLSGALWAVLVAEGRVTLDE